MTDAKVTVPYGRGVSLRGRRGPLGHGWAGKVEVLRDHKTDAPTNGDRHVPASGDDVVATAERHVVALLDEGERVLADVERDWLEGDAGAESDVEREKRRFERELEAERAGRVERTLRELHEEFHGPCRFEAVAEATVSPAERSAARRVLELATAELELDEEPPVLWFRPASDVGPLRPKEWRDRDQRGFCDLGRGVVAIRAGDGPALAAEVAAHETAHIYYRYLDGGDPLSERSEAACITYGLSARRWHESGARVYHLPRGVRLHELAARAKEGEIVLDDDGTPWRRTSMPAFAACGERWSRQLFR